MLKCELSFVGMVHYCQLVCEAHYVSDAQLIVNNNDNYHNHVFTVGIPIGSSQREICQVPVHCSEQLKLGMLVGYDMR